MSDISHNCGLAVAHTLHDTYSLIKSLQHRGREATGIAAIGEERIDVIKWKGPVDRFDITDLHKIFPSPKYHTFMAHVRYATRGRKDKILEDAHPNVIGGRSEKKGDLEIILDCDMAIVHNGQVNPEYLKEVDMNLLTTGCDTEALLHLFKEKGEYYLLRNIPGAYTIAIADKRRKDIIVLRDRTGIKPGVLGWKDGKYGVASEEIAFRNNGGELIEDLDPGSVYYLTPKGDYRKEQVIQPNIKHCFFEWNYIGNFDSIINKTSVRKLRETLGEVLAKEFHPKADLVTYIPRCPEVAARSYAKKTNLPFIPIFFKIHSERSFLGSTVDDREKSIKNNMYILPHMKDELKGKTVIVIDDSTVRGNNSKHTRNLLYDEAKVKKAYLVNFTPPIGIIPNDNIPRGCEYGVDMPPTDDFIARNRSIEEISEKIGMPVTYISSEGMLKAYKSLGIKSKNLCTFCIGGEKPF
ncbi:hypothetical protein KY313_03280 [Candidatus Woesearchaeota archaeon]|jgi:amidophosphoribosyltransferase|nr:hypothetical protein [Candidatus Woesearchaeota archaeon]